MRNSTRHLCSIVMALGALFVVAGSAYSFDIGKLLKNHTGAEPAKLIHVADLDRMMKDGAHPIYIYDANPPSVRESEGIIPGAHLLPSSDGYDPARELPPNKNAELVFYCHNLSWMASDAAARRAAKDGYTNLYEMKDGITGWAQAGMPVAHISR